MINRRRPIQSIVAGRKMFSNGGVVPPPMGAPPMGAPPMGAPPMGILNSSPELAQAASFSQPPPTLVDSMVNEATAGYGQGLQDSTAMNAAPVPMAHGGMASEDMIKSYRHGGVHVDSGGATIPSPNESVQAPRIQGSSLYSSGYTPNPYGSEVAIRSLSPSGQDPLSILQAETDAERLNRLFPEALAGSMTKPSGERYSTAPSMTRQMLGKIPGRVGTFLEDVTKDLESASNYVDSFLSQRFRGQEDILKYLFSEEEEKSGRSLGERRALTEMISRRPDLADKILNASVPLIGKHDDSQKFSQELAKNLSLEFESGAVLNASGIDDVTSEDQLVTGERYDPPEPVRINQFAVPSGDEESDYIDSVNEMIRAYGESMKSNDPNAQTVFAQELMARTDLTDEFKQAVLQSANEEGGVTEITQDVTTSEPFSVNAAQPPVEGAVTDPFAEAQIEADEAMFQGAKKEDANAALRKKHEAWKNTTDPSKKGEEPFTAAMIEADEAMFRGSPDEDSSKDASGAVVSNDNEPRQNTHFDLDSAVNEFMDRMPKYEDDAYSSGLRLLMLGAAIAGGKSDKAIINISNGLMKVLPEFIKDAEDKKKYMRSVKMAGAKYGLTKRDQIEQEQRAEDRARNSYYLDQDVTLTSPDGTERTIKAGWNRFNQNQLEQIARTTGKNLVPEAVWIQASKNKLAQIKADAERTGYAKKTSKYKVRLNDKFNDIELDVYYATPAGMAQGRKPVLATPMKLVRAYEDAVGSNNALLSMANNAFKMISDPDQDMTGYRGVMGKMMDFWKGATGAPARSLVPGVKIKGMNRGNDLSNVNIYNTHLKFLAIQMAPMLLGESGKTISDGDRRLIAEALGMATSKDGKFSWVESATVSAGMLRERLGIIKSVLQRNRDAVDRNYTRTWQEFGMSPTADNQTIAYQGRIIKPTPTDRRTRDDMGFGLKERNDGTWDIVGLS